MHLRHNTQRYGDHSDIMKTGKFLMSGVAAGVVILVLSQAMQLIVASIMPYNVLTLAGMRSVNDPIMILFFLHPFVLGLAMAYAYQHIVGSLKGNEVSKGTSFGALMWLVVSVPSAFLVWSSMNYPIGFTVSSIIGGLLYMLAAGILIAKMSK